MAGTVDDTLVLSVLRELRKESREQRELLSQILEQLRRTSDRLESKLLGLERRQIGLEERMHSLGPDLELMIKSELLGRLTHFETVIEQTLSAQLAETQARPD
jgi:hypothetical protein